MNQSLLAENAMSSSATAIERDHFLWALDTLCRIYRIPFDRGLLLQQFPPPHSLSCVVRAVRSLGFAAHARAAAAGELARIESPCLIFRAEAPALVVRNDGASMAIVEPGSTTPRMVDANTVAAAGPVWIARFWPEATLLGDDGGAAERHFGFAWFIPELLRYRSVWRDVLLASAAIQLLALVVPLLTQVVVDKVVAHQTMNTLIVIGVALMLTVAFSAVISWVRQYLILHTGNRVDAVLGMRAFEHLLRLPPRYFEARPTGTLVARLQAIETIREFVSGAAITLLLDLPFLAIYAGVMFWYSWQLSLVSVAVLAAICALSLGIVPLLRSRLNRQFLLGARNQALLTEYVAAIETVKSLQLEPQLRRRFGDQLGAYLAASFSARQLSNGYGVAANALEQLLTLLVLCMGAWMVMQNEGFTIGMLVAFQMVASRMSQPVMRLVGLWQEMQQAGIAVSRLGDIMNAPVEPYSSIPSGASSSSGDIEIEDLSFRYAEDAPRLYRDFNLRISAGSCVALMGPSGCGKSTLARLLLGFLTPSAGTIRVGGRDTRNLSVNELRNHFGVVPQETMLFSKTIYDNLVESSSAAQFEDVLQACKFAEIHDFIEGLPLGYQTRIGEHGNGLSVGQKQRLAIARALLKRAPILIFDEATASVDAETAEQLALTISALRGKVTIIFIAHQLPRGLIVDQTVVLAQRA